jgi:hypothetical protein
VLEGFFAWLAVRLRWAGQASPLGEQIKINIIWAGDGWPGLAWPEKRLGKGRLGAATLPGRGAGKGGPQSVGSAVYRTGLARDH